MKSPKTYAILILALTTLGGAGLAWQQYQELVELRAAGLNKDERVDWQKRLAAQEKINRELQDQLAATGDSSGDVAAAATRGPPNRGDQGGRGGRGGPGGFGGPGGRGGNNAQQAAVRAAMAKPEVQALIAIQNRARLEGTYGSLFKSLNLSSAQVDKVASLLDERQNTRQDVMTAARDQGINPFSDRGALNKLMTDAQTSVNDSIKATIGEAGFAQLQNYEQTMPERNVVNQLQQRLAFGDSPLTQAQSEQLVQILAANAPPSSDANGPQDGPPPGRGGPGGGGGPGGFGGGPGGGGGGGATVPVTAAVVSQSQSVLSASQLAALQQMQQQQAAADQLRQIVTAAEQAAGGGNGRGGNQGGPGGGGGGRRGGG